MWEILSPAPDDIVGAIDRVRDWQCGGIEHCTTCQLQDMMQNRSPGLKSLFRRKLGAENVWFEEFDLGTQLGVAYQNPQTGKRHATRFRSDAGPDEVYGAIRKLKEKTA